MRRGFLEPFRRPSLLRRLVGVLLGAGLLCVAVCVGLLLAFLLRTRTGELDTGMVITAQGLLATVQDDGDPGVIARKAARIQRIDEEVNGRLGLWGLAGESAYQVVRADRGLVYRTRKAPTSILAPALEGIREVERDGQRWRVATVVAEEAQVAVHVAVRRQDRLRLLGLLLGMELVYLGLGSGVVLLVFALAAHRGLHPLMRLAELVRQRDPGDLSPVVPAVSYLETAPLVEALNRLLAGTRHHMDQQKTFLAEAAHELRTPLAVVGAQAHVLAQAQDPVERAQAMADLQGGLDRAAQGVRQLLTVARLEAEGDQASVEPLDLEAFLRDLALAYAPRCIEAGQDLAFFGSGPVSFRGRREALRSAMENLLENALKYAGPGAQVDLRLEADDARIRIQVADNGPGVPSACLERLGERFYRVPGQQAPGTGLGLAIVSRVAAAHGGALDIAPGVEGRGLGFTLDLPRTCPSHREVQG